jgi:hypothetical protein
MAVPPKDPTHLLQTHKTRATTANTHRRRYLHHLHLRPMAVLLKDPTNLLPTHKTRATAANKPKKAPPPWTLRLLLRRKIRRKASTKAKMRSNAVRALQTLKGMYIHLQLACPVGT